MENEKNIIELLKGNPELRITISPPIGFSGQAKIDTRCAGSLIKTDTGYAPELMEAAAFANFLNEALDRHISGGSIPIFTRVLEDEVQIIPWFDRPTITGLFILKGINPNEGRIKETLDQFYPEELS